MKRRVMTLEEIRKEFEYFPHEYDNDGICAIVSVEDMGFCKDGITRWYTFTDINGRPAIYFKH